jgi:CelD/BcsL family acetyltransferase involved in cellulose biosynthesis
MGAHGLTGRVAIRLQGRARGAWPLTEPLDLERVDPSAIRAEWGQLAAASRNVFATPEWHETWWRHFGSGRELELSACRAKDGRLVAVIPLYVVRRFPLRVLRFTGHGPGDQLGPVCAPADREAVAEALRRALRRTDLLVADLLPADEGWADTLRARRLRHEGSPLVRFDGMTWDEYLASRSWNVRSKIRRSERKVAAQGGTTRMADPDRLEDELDALFRLHGARWAAGTSAFEPNRAFHVDFARTALQAGWLRLSFIEIENEPIAACYGFRYAGVECFYQGGRDPSWDKLSVGTVILAQAIRAALEDGVEEYRFLRGGEDYKYRLASSDSGLETLAVPITALGRAAAWALDLRLKRQRASSG